MTARLLTYSADTGTMVPADVSECERLMADGITFWLDVVTTDGDELDRLGERFNFDPAAIEDIIDIEQLPKFDNYGDHLFVVLHALTSDGDRIDTVEVDCFVGDGLLVTVSSKPITGISWLWRSVQAHTHMAQMSAPELFAQLTEVIGRRYLEVIAAFEARIDDIADDALDADPDVLGDIQVLRREETTVRKVLRPQRLVLANLRRGTIPLLETGTLAMLGDAYDVHNQVVESLAAARALLSDALDTYRGAAADRQATATTILAVYSAILLPLTLITGWYGMNLARLPGAEHRWSWELVLGVMGLLALLSFAAFVKAGFIRPPDLGRDTVLRGLAGAAKAPVKPFTMLRKPSNRRSGPDRSNHSRAGRAGR
jgi:magnesium transporter